MMSAQVFGEAFGGGMHGAILGQAVVTHPLLFIARNIFLLAFTAPSLYFLLHYLWTFKVCPLVCSRLGQDYYPRSETCMMSHKLTNVLTTV